MQREHTTVLHGSASPSNSPAAHLRPANEEEAASVVAVAISLLSVTATALRKGDIDEDLMRDCRTAIRTTEDSLRGLLDVLNGLTEAEYRWWIAAERYEKARDVYLPLNDAEQPCKPEERRFYRAIDDLLDYRCVTMGGVHAKARLFLHDETLLDILANSDEHVSLKHFLASLTSEGGDA